jgi:hypothetical protein
MPRSLLAAVGLGLLAALAVLGMRAAVEASFRDIDLVLDGPDWETLAVQEGRDPLAFFGQARAHGATAVSVYERTLKQMAARGELVYRSGGELVSEARLRTPIPPFADVLSSGSVRPGRVYVAAPPQLVEFLEAAFADLLSSARVRRILGALELTGFRDDLEEAPLGYLPDDLARYARLGLRPVLRVRNYPGFTADGLRNKVARLARLGRGYTVVFDKTEVLGAEGLVDHAADALRAADFRYGRIEVFSVKRKQRGEDRLADLMRPNVIRLFSLTAEELLPLTPASVRDKFVLAARERNVRILYLRPIMPTAGIVATDADLTFLDSLTGELARFGLRPGPARPLPQIRVPPLLMLGTILGALAAMGLTLMLFGRAVGIAIPVRLVWTMVGAGMLVSVLLIAGGPWALWRKVLALGTASTIPVLAIAVTSPRRGTRPFTASLRALWMASGISIAGGVFVGALLTGWEFMMASDIFLGVKLATVIPVILVAVMMATADRPPRHWREGLAQLWTWSSRPLLFRYALVALIAGLAAVILLARSGNFGLPVLPVEERLRALVGDLLVARPRTKEYLIGHPALQLAAAAATAGWRWGVAPLAAIGAIGQAGIINSFSHIHTPLVYSAWRTLNALVLGSVVGTLALGLLRLATIIASRLGLSSSRRR